MLLLEIAPAATSRPGSCSSSAPTPQGIVTIYRGLPYNLPFGINLYETYYVAGRVPGSRIPADHHNSSLNHDIREQTSAQEPVNALELGKITK